VKARDNYTLLRVGKGKAPLFSVDILFFLSFSPPLCLICRVLCFLLPLHPCSMRYEPFCAAVRTRVFPLRLFGAFQHFLSYSHGRCPHRIDPSPADPAPFSPAAGPLFRPSIRVFTSGPSALLFTRSASPSVKPAGSPFFFDRDAGFFFQVLLLLPPRHFFVAVLSAFLFFLPPNVARIFSRPSDLHILELYFLYPLSFPGSVFFLLTSRLLPSLLRRERDVSEVLAGRHFRDG